MNWYKLYKKANRDNAILLRINNSEEYKNLSINEKNNILNLIKEADPTSNKQYSDWITKLLVEGIIRLPEDQSKLLERLTQFNKLIRSPKFKNAKNIYEYKTYGDLAKTIDENLNNLSNKEQFRENAIKGAELVLDKEPYKVYKITTEEGASLLCKNTDWCVKDPKYSKDYLSRGPFYLILKNNQKYVLAHFEDNQFMDIYDRPIDYKLKDEIIDLLFPITGFNKYNNAGLAYDYILRTHIDNISEEKRNKLEKVIATNAQYSYYYAYSVLNRKRFELGEKIIATSSHYSYKYARDILNGERFILGEKVIATNAHYSYLYALIVLNGRFILGEKTILNSEYKNVYLSFLKGKGIKI